jgi:3-hydroxyacyl-[acyl-carrier-protein] dehydratase
MLRGILYEILTVDPDGATIRLLPESPVYRGHFPGYPITPGVCLVQIALELIGEMAGQAGQDERKVRMVAAKSIKFMRPVLPSEGTELRFNLAGEGSNWNVDILSGGILCAKMNLTVE